MLSFSTRKWKEERVRGVFKVGGDGEVLWVGAEMCGPSQRVLKVLKMRG